MTDAQLKKLAKEHNYDPTYELISFARLVLINAKIQDLKSVAINTQLAVEKEREACAKMCEEMYVPEESDWHWSVTGREVLQEASDLIRARGGK